MLAGCWLAAPVTYTHTHTHTAADSRIQAYELPREDLRGEGGKAQGACAAEDGLNTVRHGAVDEEEDALERLSSFVQGACFRSTVAVPSVISCKSHRRKAHARLGSKIFQPLNTCHLSTARQATLPSSSMCFELEGSCGRGLPRVGECCAAWPSMPHASQTFRRNFGRGMHPACNGFDISEAERWQAAI